MKKTYLIYKHHSKIDGLSEPILVNRRDPELHARELPSEVFAFGYFDQITTVVQTGRLGRKLSSERFDVSPIYFVDAEVFTEAQLEGFKYDKTKVGGPLKYMLDHGHEAMVRTRHRNFEVWHLDPTRNEIINTK